MVRVSTRDEILRVAAEQFTRTGYKGTSLQEIAAAVGCSKATLLYHFATKDAILHALVAPAVQALTELMTYLDGLDNADVQAAAIDGFVDLVLRFRREVALIYDVIPQFLHEPAFDTVRPMTDRLCAIFAGDSPDPARFIAAEVVLGGIAGVVIDDQRDAAELRPALTGVARRALFPPPPDKD
ncbi:TetR/AcrR family transcriptional regulator [Actinoplanes sp. NPDC051494]|uniref:TetR/AcrR family transcriptional regulator n=1 Tax=Actinoplanes sp. NPDC051494 TaxID=3363907 RepID=UPI00379A5C3E